MMSNSNMNSTQPKQEFLFQEEAENEIEIELSQDHQLIEAIQNDVMSDEHDLSSEILKSEAQSLPQVLVDDELLKELSEIPDRFGFKIGDVADLLGIKQYVLRYWEQEFDILNPKKASNNQRLYTKKNVENAFLIRKLLYRDKFSIEGARRALKDVKSVLRQEKKKDKDFVSVIQRIEFVQSEIRSFIDDIKQAKKLFN